MAVRGSELRLSFGAKKRPTPPFPPRFLSLSPWERQGLPRLNSQQKEGFTVFVCLPQTVRLVALFGPQRSPPAECVCSPQRHTHTHTHHPAIKMPAGLNKERVCSERFGIPVKAFFFSFFFFSPPSNPRDPERKLENDWSQILPVKGWKTVRKTGVTSHCGDYNDERFLKPRLTVCSRSRLLSGVRKLQTGYFGYWQWWLQDVNAAGGCSDWFLI